MIYKYNKRWFSMQSMLRKHCLRSAGKKDELCFEIRAILMVNILYYYNSVPDVMIHYPLLRVLAGTFMHIILWTYRHVGDKIINFVYYYNIYEQTDNNNIQNYSANVRITLVKNYNLPPGKINGEWGHAADAVTVFLRVRLYSVVIISRV